MELNHRDNVRSVVAHPRAGTCCVACGVRTRVARMRAELPKPIRRTRRGAPARSRAWPTRVRNPHAASHSGSVETCLGIGPSRAGLQSATRSQRRTSFERATGIEPVCKNLADFRLTSRPCSHLLRGRLDLLSEQRFKLGAQRGATCENRTRVICLEGRGLTIRPRSR
jgi:hypothetical protein